MINSPYVVMENLPDSQQSFEEVWTSSFPSNGEPLFSDLSDINDIAEESTLKSLQTDLDKLFPDIAEIPQSKDLVNVPCESFVDPGNLLDSPKEVDFSVTASDIAQKTIVKVCLPDLPGHYGFELTFGEQSLSVTKSTNFVHSAVLNKLFVRMNQVCPFEFHCAVNPPPGCTIRAAPLFKNSEHASKSVMPCLHHRKGSEVFLNSGFHLVHSEMPSAFNVNYGFNAEGHESVSCSCGSDPSNMKSFILCYKFTCLSSCQSGINRRPVVLVFTLEGVNGEILGRRSVNLCICACPGRDRAREEDRQTRSKPNRKLKRPCTSTSNDTTLSKYIKDDSNSGDDETFVMAIQGRKKYEKLLAIKQALDLEELVPPEKRRQYFSEENS